MKKKTNHKEKVLTKKEIEKEIEQKKENLNENVEKKINSKKDLDLDSSKN